MYPWNKPGVGTRAFPKGGSSLTDAKTSHFPFAIPLFTKARTLYRTLRFHIPLTLQGTLTLCLALYLLIHGLANRNAYEILLGLLFSLFLAILLGVGYVLRRTCQALTPTWQIPNPVCAVDLAASHFPASGKPANVPHRALGNSAAGKSVNSSFLEPMTLTQANLHRIGGIPRVPPFFRVHFEVQGTLTVGQRGVVFHAADWSLRPDDHRQGISPGSRQATEPQEITGTLPLHLGGEFQGAGCRTLRDIFGMVRYHLPPVLHRSFPVLPAPSRKRIQLRLDPSLGLEEKRTLRSADEERYFMREYAPGDRFRDINWKTSSRLAFLVTRIAPQAQEKTRILPVAFRCFGPVKPDLWGLWALDRCKAWLIQFLWTVRKEHPEFILRVTTPLLEKELATDQETERFCEELAEYSFHSLSEEGKFTYLLSTPEEVFVFSTAYDGGLSRFVGGRFDLPTHLYVTTPFRRFPGRVWGRNGITPSPSLESSRFSLRGCLREGAILFPRLLLPIPVPSASPPRPLRGILEIEPTEVSL